MPVDMLVDKNPTKIKTPEDVDEILKRIRLFEREKECNAGVIVIQRRQFTALYEIVSQEEGGEWLRKSVSQTTPEFGIKYFSRQYFEALRERLKGNKAYPLPEPLSWEHYKK